MPRPVTGIEIKRNKGCLQQFNGEQERGQPAVGRVGRGGTGYSAWGSPGRMLEWVLKDK